VTRELSNRSSKSFAALIVQDAILRSEAWAQRIAEVSDDFVRVRFPDRFENLVNCSRHFEMSIALLDRSLFESVPPEILSRFACSGASVRLVIRIDGTETSKDLERLILLGCDGFVSAAISGASLRRVLRAVSAGEIAAPRSVLSCALRDLLAGKNSPKLSRREQDVLALLGQRFNNKRIARELFISEETLRWHLRNLYTKTNIESRAEMVEHAVSMLSRNGGGRDLYESPGVRPSKLGQHAIGA
jgi:DNA-binding NarL/FixJ family response regulator